MAAPKWKPDPLTPKEIASIKTMAGYGLTVEKIAACLDMSKKTLERRMQKQPEARDAISKGRAMAETNVTQALYEMAISKKCPAATIFWIKCRARWSEPKDNDQPADDDKTTTVYETQFGSTPVTKNKKTNP